MLDKFIEELNVLKSEVKEWPLSELEVDTAYILCEKIDDNSIHVDKNNITLTREDSTISVTMGLEFPAKFWGHLFSLPSYLKAQKEAVSSMENVEVYRFDIDEPVNMHIEYGFTITTDAYKDVSPLIDKAEEIAEIVRKKTIEKLVKKANYLLED